MKKIVYIGLLFLGLVASSCSKEEIVTTSNNANSAPEWNSNARPEGADLGDPDSSDDSGIKETNIGGGSIINLPTNDVPSGEITDPNNDPDGIKKRT